jgi:hypothetical protein
VPSTNIIDKRIPLLLIAQVTQKNTWNKTLQPLR